MVDRTALEDGAALEDGMALVGGTALVGKVLSKAAVSVTVADGAMTVWDINGAIFAGDVMFGETMMVADGVMLMDEVGGVIVMFACKWVFTFGAAVIGDDGGLVFMVESLMESMDRGMVVG